MNRDTEQTSTDKLQELIYQTYESTPHADPVRLAAIERSLAPHKQRQHSTKRSRTPWWVIGLALTAGTAAAWWAVQQQSFTVDQAQKEITISPPPDDHVSGSNEALSSEEKAATNVAAMKGDSSTPDSTTQKAHAPDKHEKEGSTVIFSREVF